MKKKAKNKKKRKMNKKDKRIIIICCIIFVLCIAGIIGYYLMLSTPEPKKAAKKEISQLKIVDQNSNQRPIAVMIDNNVGNNAHEGLQDSYINYEIIVEGGLTRIMALYKDKDVAKIGPVRSSRHYFLDFSSESDAIYAHYGWSTYAEKDIKALGINNVNGLTSDSAYWRDKTIKAPHNVFTSTEKIYETAKKMNYKTTTKDWKLLNYSVKEITFKDPADGEEDNRLLANSVSLKYSNYQTVSYTYDSENKYYLRSMNGKPHTDKSTDQQLHYKNIIVEQVFNKLLDNDGRQDLETEGNGSGYYITNGYALPIKWEKDTRTSKTKYTYEDGTEVKVNDGNTFIQILPATQTPEIN